MSRKENSWWVKNSTVQKTTRIWKKSTNGDYSCFKLKIMFYFLLLFQRSGDVCRMLDFKVLVRFDPDRFSPDVPFLYDISSRLDVFQQNSHIATYEIFNFWKFLIFYNLRKIVQSCKINFNCFSNEKKVSVHTKLMRLLRNYTHTP